MVRLVSVVWVVRLVRVVRLVSLVWVVRLVLVRVVLRSKAG